MSKSYTMIERERAGALFFGFATLLCLLILWIGLVPQHKYSEDLYALLDSGYRINQGLVPYKDYDSILSPGSMLICALGLALTNDQAIGLPISIALSYVPIAAFSWILVSSRFKPFISFLICFYLGLVWCSSVPLHFAFFDSSYAMYYNRQSYVLICLLFLILCTIQSHNIISSHLLIGFLLGLLFFFKISYVSTGFLLVVVLLPLQGLNILNLALLLIGFVFSSIPFLAFLHLDGLEALLRNDRNAFLVRSPDIYKSGLLLLLAEIPLFVFLLFQSVSGLITLRIKANLPPKRLRLAYEFIVLIGVGSLTELGGSPSFELPEVPLITIFAIIILSRVLAIYAVDSLKDIKLEGIKILFPLLIIILMPCMNASLGILYPVFQYPANGRLGLVHSPWFPAYIQVQDDVEMSRVSVCGTINDGIALILRHPELDRAAIGCLDFSDAFPFCLHRPPPPHMPLFFDRQATLNAQRHPPAERIFYGCDAFLEPAHDVHGFPVLEVISDYRKYVDAHYQIVDRTAYWNLWERAPNSN